MRILVVHNAFRSFVEMDRDILGSKHEVTELDLSRPARVLRLPRLLANTDLVYCWFASLHSLAPALSSFALRKPVISVVGAYDAADIPEIGFGHMGHPWKRYVVRTVCAASSLLVCNSDYALETVKRNVHVKTPAKRIYHGVEFSDRPPGEVRERLALSVGQIRHVNLKRKGHEVFARASVLLPDVRFLLVGQIMDDSVEYLRSIGGPNLEIKDHVAQSELEDLYFRASVYVQASAHESFGLSVVEAMGTGAIAVVSNRGALPEIVGPHGIYIDEKGARSVADGILQGLPAGEEQREASKRFVRQRFPLKRRRIELLDTIAEVVRSRTQDG